MIMGGISCAAVQLANGGLSLVRQTTGRCAINGKPRPLKNAKLRRGQPAQVSRQTLREIAARQIRWGGSYLSNQVSAKRLFCNNNGIWQCGPAGCKRGALTNTDDAHGWKNYLEGSRQLVVLIA